MKSMLFSRTLRKYIFLGWMFGTTYVFMEVVYRNGSTHWTMFFVGAIAAVLVGGVNNWLPWEMSFLLQMTVGATLITAVEFVAGLILNVWLRLNIWDYSNQPYNALGQICLMYFFMWFGLSAVAILLDDYIRYYVFGEDEPHYYLFNKTKGSNV